MSHPQPQSRSHPQLYPAYGPEEIDCLVATILGYLLPFYMVGSDGNGTVAGASIVALIQDCCPVTPIEFDLAGRLVGYGVAAMDNLQMSMRPGLSDAKVLQYRAGAVALGRSAEQCRKALDAIRARRELHEAATAQSIPASPSAPTPPLAPSAPASPAEMFRVFNMGIGFVVICARDIAKSIIDHLAKDNVPAWEIGEVREGEVGVKIE